MLLQPNADEPRVALAGIVAADPNVDAPLTGNLNDFDGPPEGVVGWAPEHVVIYAADAIPQTSTWGQYLRGSYAPGYYVLRVSLTPECLALETDNNTSILDEPVDCNPVFTPEEDGIRVVLGPYDQVQLPPIW